ncbi:hypothetical protein BT63DRAFT_467024 [Microthyrium microscopicum]|uniref:GPR1/FUN34/YaaH-class plasma membrane protein n=1 Tax=Microthyrium microscopicum TaxID=703497 RepID=A0A6A6UP47_9PEZI|nr:hypothetical protein BT63DRAFT_467024 [Microthyrium microscopicum]
MSGDLHSEHSPPIHKDYGNGHSNGGDFLHPSMTQDQALHRIRTAGSISISPELFEKLYLSPANNVKGDLRKTFANPTPLALIGFLIALNPLACDLMGWRGTGGVGVGAAGVGTYYFFGGLLMILGGLGEWLLGNTFPFVVFSSFGAYWLSLGATFTPAYAAQSAYGQDTAAYYASFAFFFVFMGLVCLIYLVCSLRTNVAFVIIFFSLVLAFSCLSATYWQAANGNMATSATLQKASGGILFVTCVVGWWIFAAIMLASLDFPFALPVGDLSNFIKPGSARRSKAETADGGV